MIKKWVLGLVVMALLLAPAAALAAGGCPPQAKIYAGGPVTNASAMKGSLEHPAADTNEGLAICQHCANGGYIYYNYDTVKKQYLLRSRCAPESIEPTGAPLAEVALMGGLALLAFAGISWGLYTRRRLQQE